MIKPNGEIAKPDVTNPLDFQLFSQMIKSYSKRPSKERSRFPIKHCFYELDNAKSSGLVVPNQEDDTRNFIENHGVPSPDTHHYNSDQPIVPPKKSAYP